MCVCEGGLHSPTPWSMYVQHVYMYSTQTCVKRSYILKGRSKLRDTESLISVYVDVVVLYVHSQMTRSLGN